MQPDTHLAIDPRLCGCPAELAPGRARVELTTVAAMAADERGLVHGGFVFGCADYAAMLAVNHPLVVLAAAEVRFLRPVRVGERLVAEAEVEAADGRKRRVRVRVGRGGEMAGETAGETVFEGTFTCAVPDAHVLDPRPDAGS